MTCSCPPISSRIPYKVLTLLHLFSQFTPIQSKCDVSSCTVPNTTDAYALVEVATEEFKNITEDEILLLEDKVLEAYNCDEGGDYSYLETFTLLRDTQEYYGITKTNLGLNFTTWVAKYRLTRNVCQEGLFVADDIGGTGRYLQEQEQTDSRSPSRFFRSVHRRTQACKCPPLTREDFLSDLNLLIQDEIRAGNVQNFTSVINITDMEHVEDATNCRLANSTNTTNTTSTPWSASAMVEWRTNKTVLTEEDLARIGARYQALYNQLNSLGNGFCDPAFRVIRNVRVTIENSTTVRALGRRSLFVEEDLPDGGNEDVNGRFLNETSLGPTFEPTSAPTMQGADLFYLYFETEGDCVLCSQDAGMFNQVDLRRRRQLLSSDPNLSVEEFADQCWCPVGSEIRAPTLQEFVRALNETGMVAALYEVEAMECVPFTPFVSQEEYEFAGNRTLINSTILSALSSVFLATYMEVSATVCDPYFRTIDSVWVGLMSNSSRVLIEFNSTTNSTFDLEGLLNMTDWNDTSFSDPSFSPTVSPTQSPTVYGADLFTLAFRTTGECSGCPADSSLFDFATEVRQLSADMDYSLLNSNSKAPSSARQLNLAGSCLCERNAILEAVPRDVFEVTFVVNILQSDDIPSDVIEKVLIPLPPPTVSPAPSNVPSTGPTSIPSSSPNVPSVFPSAFPSSFPSGFPSSFPSGLPSFFPSAIPTDLPSDFPSALPTTAPSESPSEEACDSGACFLGAANEVISSYDPPTTTTLIVGSFEQNINVLFPSPSVTAGEDCANWPSFPPKTVEAVVDSYQVASPILDTNLLSPLLQYSVDVTTTSNFVFFRVWDDRCSEGKCTCLGASEPTGQVGSRQVLFQLSLELEEKVVYRIESYSFKSGEMGGFIEGCLSTQNTFSTLGSITSFETSSYPFAVVQPFQPDALTISSCSGVGPGSSGTFYKIGVSYEEPIFIRCLSPGRLYIHSGTCFDETCEAQFECGAGQLGFNFAFPTGVASIWVYFEPSSTVDDVATACLQNTGSRNRRDLEVPLLPKPVVDDHGQRHLQQTAPLTAVTLSTISGFDASSYVGPISYRETAASPFSPCTSPFDKTNGKIFVPFTIAQGVTEIKIACYGETKVEIFGNSCENRVCYYSHQKCPNAGSGEIAFSLTGLNAGKYVLRYDEPTIPAFPDDCVAAIDVGDGPTGGSFLNTLPSADCPDFSASGIGFFRKAAQPTDGVWDFPCLFNSPEIYVFAAPDDAASCSNPICLYDERSGCPTGGVDFSFELPSTDVLQTSPNLASVTSFTYYVWYFWPSNA